MLVRIALLLALNLTLTPLLADEEALVNGFESEDELAHWEVNAAGARLVAQHATQGASALEATFNPDGEYYPVTLFWNRVIADWSPYDALVVDVFNPNDFPVEGNVLVADVAWLEANRSYWNRHNGGTTFAPGSGRWVIPVRGLYRGEAGSRNNDIKTDIDPTRIVRLDLNFGSRGQGGTVIVDNIRFVSLDTPEAVRAFDFGPPSQPVMLGWTGVSNESAYDQALGYGWGPQGGTPWAGAARDTTFGTMLTQDFCEAGGYRFRVDVPPGEYEAVVIYENCGYWGGEQARHTERSITVNGEVLWSERRPDGPSTALYRFEDVEPVGVDIWDTYMADELARPVRINVTAGADGLVFAFASDVTFGSRLSALALAPAGDAAAVAWLEGQLDSVASEFRAKAVSLDPPAPEFAPAPEWAARGLVAWPVLIDDDVTPGSIQADGPLPDELRLGARVVRGEYEPLCLAIRALEDLGDAAVSLTWTTDRALPARVQRVWYNTSRGFGSIAYHIRPHTLRDADSLPLEAGVTRELVVTLEISEDATPGLHSARLELTADDGRTLLAVPIDITVDDLVLHKETPFLMGFFGLMPPEELLMGGAAELALEDTLELLREHGMNGLSGGPNISLIGWQAGEPQIDFSEADAFFATCKAAGMDRANNGYGGLRFVGLHDGYQKGDTADRVAQESGLDYEQAFMRAWAAVDAHARANDWPLIYYAMCDETRVRDVAERELEFMELMARASEAFPDTVRASGSYSVTFDTRPTDPDDMLTWHQRFFEALDVSSLNDHDPSVMEEARKLGKEIHIYNQGQSRYSFGLYQWSEFAKGVAARWQWHLNILHGYQFFDLDGREPDTAMICYGREAIFPTIHFERCREGAEEFYLLQMLAQRAEDSAEAAALLDELVASVALNQRTPPAGYDPLRIKDQIISALR